MIVDAQLQLSGSITGNTVTAQTVTGSSAVLSTNTADLLQAIDIGEGADLYARIQVGTAFTGLTALTCDVIAADDAALTSNVTVIGSTGSIAVASLTAGARFAAKINPRIASKGQRYLGLRYTPTGTGTAGTVVADIGIGVQDGQKNYPVGFAVL